MSFEKKSGKVQLKAAGYHDITCNDTLYKHYMCVTVTCKLTCTHSLFMVKTCLENNFCCFFIDELTFVYTVCYIVFSTRSQKAKHIVMHGGLEQVATVSPMALLCYEMCSEGILKARA